MQSDKLRNIEKKKHMNKETKGTDRQTDKQRARKKLKEGSITKILQNVTQIVSVIYSFLFVTAFLKVESPDMKRRRQKHI